MLQYYYENIVKSRNLAGCILDLLINQYIENFIKTAFFLPKTMSVQELWSANESYRCCRLRSLLFLGLIISTIYFGVSLIALFKLHSLWQMLQVRSHVEFWGMWKNNPIYLTYHKFPQHFLLPVWRILRISKLLEQQVTRNKNRTSQEPVKGKTLQDLILLITYLCVHKC